MYKAIRLRCFSFFFFLLFNFNETASYLINEAKIQPNISTRLLVFILILMHLGELFHCEMFLLINYRVFSNLEILFNYLRLLMIIKFRINHSHSFYFLLCVCILMGIFIINNNLNANNYLFFS